ncbi:hypothetical protein IscW_ISCW019685 [Ixodes scapularis]|uniref:Uncharacterized protein n=1 Tax=Ixodes scapularis TaxID=6945 RepID=B7PVZ5_IXOSC|nr:hypothetical protein IscW_ISCW019685 [Ixodes scapularis]|eukprot:XP_002408895.1 hypothetical protein IscW_ISCW019685 [Ixodes scapularis]
MKLPRRGALSSSEVTSARGRAQAAEGDANPFATSRVRSHLRAPFHHYAHPLAQRAGGANAGGAQAQSVTALRALLGCSPSAHEPASAGSSCVAVRQRRPDAGLGEHRGRIAALPRHRGGRRDR